MTRRLGGIGQKSLAAIASLSLAATLAGGIAMVGCGGDSTPPATVEAGPEGGMGGGDAAPDRMDATTTSDGFDGNVPDRGVDAPADNFVGMEAEAAQMPCPTPTFMPNGGAVAQGSNVTITATGLPMSGFIYYTTDGTNPTHASPVYNAGIQINAAETIRAISSASTCADSAPAVAIFTLLVPEAGALTIPAFTPTSTTLNNDFLLALSSSAGATICYTLDGVTMPTCTVTTTTATCSGNSQTYNAATRISITGGITSSSASSFGTGTVNVQAIACQVGHTTTGVGSQQYTLQAAPPSMVAPAPGNQPYAGSPYTPTLSSLTTGSSIQYTTNGTTPTCAPGSPGTLLVGTTVSIAANTTVNAVACKMGYAPSTVSMSAYTITLTTPTFPAAATPGAPGTYNAATGAFTLAVDTGTSWGCVTRDGTTPTCGTTANACGGTGTLAFNPATVGPPVPANIPVASVTATGTTIEAVACSLTLNASAAAIGMFTLQLGAPDLNPPGLAAGVPRTSYTIPLAGIAPVNVEQSAGGQAYGFACVILAGTPACGVNACTTGTRIAGPFPAALGSTPAAGNVWSVIGCPAPAVAFLPSVVTSVTYSAAGASGAPLITPASAGPYTTTLRPTITNSDPAANTICYTTDGTVPTCSAGTCGGATTTTFAAAGASSAVVSSVTLTAGGSGYTGAPVVTFSGGGGTGASATATIAGGVVTGLTGLVGGTGYTTPPTITFTGGGGTGAAATAFLSNAVVIPAIQTDNQVVRAVACNGTQTVSPTSSQTYNFTLAVPDFTLVQTTMVTGDLNGGGPFGAGRQIRLSTTSNFTTESINYTTNGVTATCASGGGTNVASGTNIAVPAMGFTLSAVACGVPPAQQPSAARTAVFTVSTAIPTITNNVTGSPTGSLTWQNTFGATLSSVTAGAQLCYTTDGTTPVCSAGVCQGLATPAANNAVVMITTSGTQLRVIACTATLASSGVASANYTLNISNVLATATAACPSSVTLALDPATTTGGPTAGAAVCYTMDGTAPAAFGAACAVTVTAGTTCFNSGGGGTGGPAFLVNTTTSLNVITCKVGFNVSASTPTSVPITPYTAPIVVDGAVAEWPNPGTAMGSTNGAALTTGYMAHDATNLFFAATGYTPLASTDVVVYLGDGTVTGSTTPPAVFGTSAIPFPARWAFGWASDNSAGNTFTAFAWSGSAWTVTTLTGLTRGFQSAATVEFGLPLTSLGSPGTVTAAGAIITGVGTAPMQSAWWPGTGVTHYVRDVLSSCLPPGQQLQ